MAKYQIEDIVDDMGSGMAGIDRTAPGGASSGGSQSSSSPSNQRTASGRPQRARSPPSRRGEYTQEGDDDMPSKKQEKSGTDAITLLKQDHEAVRRMFDEFERADEDRKFELAAEICQALTVHAAIEEEIFYPQVREALAAEDLMLEAEIEHDTVRNLIERVQEGEVDETQLSAVIKVMNDYVNHHVNEEQRRMFPRVKRSELDLEALGQEMLARKTELEAELQAAMAAGGGAAAVGSESDELDDEGSDDDGETDQSRGGMAARAEGDEV